MINWTLPAFIGALFYMAVFISLISMVLLTSHDPARCRLAHDEHVLPSCRQWQHCWGYLILNEPVGPLALAGMAVAVIGVALVVAPEGKAAC